MSIERFSIFPCAVLVGALAIGTSPSSSKEQKDDHNMVSTGTSDVVSAKGTMSLRTGHGGVEVVTLSGDAARSELMEGDVIVEVAGVGIETPEQVMGYVRANPSINSIDIMIVRDDQRLPLSLAADHFRTFMTPKPPEPPVLPRG